MAGRPLLPGVLLKSRHDPRHPNLQAYLCLGLWVEKGRQEVAQRDPRPGAPVPALSPTALHLVSPSAPGMGHGHGGIQRTPSTPVPDRLPALQQLGSSLRGLHATEKGDAATGPAEGPQEEASHVVMATRWSGCPLPPSGFAFLSLLLITTIRVHCRKYEE